MKRSGFKQKLTVPMKREKLRKKSKESISKLQRQIWEECRRIADIIYPPVNGVTHCYICDKPIQGVTKQLSHLIPKSVCGAYLKYDVYRNLKWCCYHDNINLGGNLAEYYRKMLKENGQEFMDKLYQDKNKSVKAFDHYQTLLNEYKKVIL